MEAAVGLANLAEMCEKTHDSFTIYRHMDEALRRWGLSFQGIGGFLVSLSRSSSSLGSWKYLALSCFWITKKDVVENSTAIGGFSFLSWGFSFTETLNSKTNSSYSLRFPQLEN